MWQCFTLFTALHLHLRVATYGHILCYEFRTPATLSSCCLLNQMLCCQMMLLAKDTNFRFFFKHIQIYFIDPKGEIVVRQLHIYDGATKGFQCLQPPTGSQITDPDRTMQMY